jgi:hypothetical protein
MTQTIKAIETQYKGYRFRSRLEARWAVFFDALGIEWEYEKEGYDLGEAGWYLPDFWLPEIQVWIEIKGGNPTNEEMVKAENLCRGTQNSVVIFSGNPWFNIARAYYMIDDNEELWDASFYFDSLENDGYDFEKKDGHGCYYQGTYTWGLTWNSTGNPHAIQDFSEKNERKFGLICLVEGEDSRDAQRCAFAYAAARSARFEHGETPR